MHAHTRTATMWKTGTAAGRLRMTFWSPVTWPDAHVCVYFYEKNTSKSEILTYIPQTTQLSPQPPQYLEHPPHPVFHTLKNKFPSGKSRQDPSWMSRGHNTPITGCTCPVWTSLTLWFLCLQARHRLWGLHLPCLPTQILYRKSVICTRKNHIIRGFDPRADVFRWQEKRSKEFEKMYHRRSIVESAFSSFRCRFTAGCSRKETCNAKTAVTPQAHLLQSVVIVERRQKIRVMCLAYAVQSCNVLTQDAPHHILPRENSTIYRKSKATKCR